MQKVGLGQNVIIDTDMGWDDVLAILLLMKNPSITILGITVTGCGETHLEDGVYLAKSLLQLGNLDVPVCAGAASPSIHNNQFPKSFREMMDDCCGLRASLPVPTKETDSRTATEFIADMLNHEENQITIISLGGLTNIAPLLELDPAPKLENINKIVIMGGAVNVDGNVASLNSARPDWNQGPEYGTNVYAEWNIFLDALAAQKVMSSSIPMMLVPLDACDHVILDASYENLSSGFDPVSKVIKELITSKVSGPSKEANPLPVFDPLAALMGTECLRNFKAQKMRLQVVTEQSDFDNNCGQTILSQDESLPEITVVTDVSAIEFKRLFKELANAPIVVPEDEIVKKNVAILLFDKMEVLDFAGVYEVFGAARNSDNSAVFNVFTVGEDEKPKRLNAGPPPKNGKESCFTLEPDYTFEKHPKIDVLMVVGGQGIDDFIISEDARKNVIPWIQKVSKSAEYVAGICSGVLLLTKTGLLTNMEVTTHHTRFTQLQEMSDEMGLGLQVMDTRNSLNYVHDESRKFFTSGGVHCCMGAAMHLVEIYQGYDKAQALGLDILEYTIPRGVNQIPEGFPAAHHVDPTNFVLGFSHLNVIVNDLKMMDEATEFYARVLGFKTAWSLWLPDETCKHFAHDAGFDDARVMVRFLVHPNAQIHIELMMYEFPKGSSEIEFHKTNDAGGIRHVALEVHNAAAVYDWLKTHDDVKLLSKRPPEKLLPDPQTFFYWIDPFGVQWEMEQGRPMARVINGIIG